jgi:hypothetical protein
MGIRVLCVAGAIGSLVVTAGFSQGCGGSSGGSGFGSSSGGSGSGGSNGGSNSGGGNSSSSGGVVGFGDASAGEGGGVCEPNPANYDIPGNNCDDDGDGKVDNTPTCDGSLMLTGTAHDFANALGLCQDAAGQKWGIVSATYTSGFGGGGAPNDGQHGILPHFGTAIMPREGTMLGALSSGFAREWDNTGGTDTGACTYPPMSPTQYGAPCFKGYQVPMGGMGAAPPGYPKAAASCPSQMGVGIYDTISLTLQVKTPANAQGLQFDFDFYSGEWPEYVCTNFNDSFVAWLQSAAFTGKNGDLNISYDSKGNPLSVNNAFFETCTMNASTGCCANQGMSGCGNPSGTAACTNGPGGLASTGFEDDGTYCGGASTGGGATGWLTTSAPVKPGEVITLQYIIWDTGDPNWDSSVLVDHFTWQPGPTMTGTQPAQ